VIAAIAGITVRKGLKWKKKLCASQRLVDFRVRLHADSM